jgi:hypothetical protein
MFKVSVDFDFEWLILCSQCRSKAGHLFSTLTLHLISWVVWNTLLPMMLSTVLDYTSGSTDPQVCFWWKWMENVKGHWSFTVCYRTTQILDIAAGLVHLRKESLLDPWHLRIEIKLSVSTLQYKIPQLQLGIKIAVFLLKKRQPGV